MEDGQQKEKVRNRSSATCLPTAASSSDLLSLFLPTSRASQTLSATSHHAPSPPAIQLLLAPVSPPSPPRRQVKTQAAVIWLFLTSFSPSFFST